jgi:hypothetical protein
MEPTQDELEGLLRMLRPLPRPEFVQELEESLGSLATWLRARYTPGLASRGVTYSD